LCKTYIEIANQTISPCYIDMLSNTLLLFTEPTTIGQISNVLTLGDNLNCVTRVSITN